MDDVIEGSPNGPAALHYDGAESSHDSKAGAGWEDCGGPGSWAAKVPYGTKPQSWARPSTLWRARNEVVAHKLSDPTDDARRAWVELARTRERGAEAPDSQDFVVDLGTGPETSFLVFGDSGEGDGSQYAVVPDLISHSEGAQFAFICSDIIYPGGDSSLYRSRFYRPYADLQLPIYAIPGNHDWYDGLHGFMHHLCGLDAPDLEIKAAGWLRQTVLRLLWRRVPHASADDLEAMKQSRAAPEQQQPKTQPAPYYAIDTGPIRVVGIDTGILGSIDADQADWLERVSVDPDRRPKLLMTGKPLIVNNESHPGVVLNRDGSVDKTRTVDSIIRRAEANYVATIGGDIHNYQHYPVGLDDGRTMEYIVSGGGGAFMHATHQIPSVDLEGVTEDEFCCYPLRADSLARYSQLYDRRFAGGRGLLKLTSEQARWYLVRRLGFKPTLELVPPRGRLARARAYLAGLVIQPLPAQRSFQRLVSEVVDWDDPPMFKNFLRIDVAGDTLTIHCFGVLGCKNAEGNAAVEDRIEITLDRVPQTVP